MVLSQGPELEGVELVDRTYFTTMMFIERFNVEAEFADISIDWGKQSFLYV